jgi:ferredoxin--NADP+ reductase
MMKFSALTTQPFGVKTIVSLNPIMVDGTGMCGACRISVGGVTKFTCVDGPDFDGHQVNWDELFARQRIYLEEEKHSLEAWQCQCAASSQVKEG